MAAAARVFNYTETPPAQSVVSRRVGGADPEPRERGMVAWEMVAKVGEDV